MSDKFDPASIMRVDSNRPIWPIRGRAIQEYATLEQTLFSLFIHITGIDAAMAGAIFFKQTSSRGRNDTMDKLIIMKYGSKYGKFWNSYFQHLGRIDIEKNNVAHWNMMVKVSFGRDGNQINEPMLVPASIWGRHEGSPSMKEDDIKEFMLKCNIYSSLCLKFELMSAGAMSDIDKNSWLNIFQQAIVYPLPSGHPLCPIGR